MSFSIFSTGGTPKSNRINDLLYLPCIYIRLARISHHSHHCSSCIDKLQRHYCHGFVFLHELRIHQCIATRETRHPLRLLRMAIRNAWGAHFPPKTLLEIYSPNKVRPRLDWYCTGSKIKFGGIDHGSTSEV